MENLGRAFQIENVYKKQETRTKKESATPTCLTRFDANFRFCLGMVAERQSQA